MDIRIGCCGFPKSQAEYYKQFSLVEIQQTFYKPPRLPTVQRWREQAPDGFEFALKAWQLITHPADSPTYRQPGMTLDGPPEAYGSFQANAHVSSAWQQTRDVALALRAGMVLFQCPPSFIPNQANVNNLVRFFAHVDRGGLAFAWEPRGPWPEKVVWRLCKELQLVPATDPFELRPPPSQAAYFRLHGKTGYSYRYTDRDLKLLLAWCGEHQRAYCLFNNVSMGEDAMRLAEMAGVGRAGAGERETA